MAEIAELIEAAARAACTSPPTMYPYTAGGTGLPATLPLWAQEGGREKMLERLANPDDRAKCASEIETKIDGWENLLLAPRSTASRSPRCRATRISRSSASGSRRLPRNARWTTVGRLFAVLIENEGRVGALYHMMSEDDVKTGCSIHG